MPGAFSEVLLLYFVQTMSSRRRQRSTHKRRPTPKGEAGTALEHAEACLRELETISSPNQKETFARRLNEFLGAARRVSEFLPKETGRAPELKSWVQQEHDNLTSYCKTSVFGLMDGQVGGGFVARLLRGGGFARFSGLKGPASKDAGYRERPRTSGINGL